MKKTTLEKIVGYLAIFFAVLYYTILAFTVSDVLFETAKAVEKFLIISGFFLLASLHLMLGMYFLMLAYNSQRVQHVITTIKKDILDTDDRVKTKYEEKVIMRLRDLVE